MKINQGQHPVQQQVIRDGAKGSVNTGKVLEGTVVSTNGKEVVLDIEGRLQTLTNLSEKTFALNQQARFVVIASENGKTFVRAEGPSELYHQVAELPMTSVGQEAQEIKVRVDLLQRLNMPITPDNYDKVKQMTAEVKVLLGEFMNSNEAATSLLASSESLEQPLKALILALSQTTTSKPEMQNQELQQNQEAQQSQQTPEASKPDVSYATARGDALKMMLQETATSQIQDLFQTLKSEGLASHAIKELLLSADLPLPEGINENEKALISILREQMGQNQLPIKMVDDMLNKIQRAPLPLPLAAEVILSQFDTSQQGMLLKNDTILNLKNLMMTQLQSQNSFSVSDGFSALNASIKKLPTALQLAVLEMIQSEKPEEALVKLQQMIKQADVDDGLKNTINKEIVFVKEASQITKQFGDQVYVMQMPVQFEDETRHVNFYVKSRKQEKNDEDFTLLIALKTHYIDEVRCIVEKRQNRIGLHFKLADETIKKIFEENTSLLEQALQKIEVKSYHIDFAVNKTALPALLIEDPVPLQVFDLKV